MTPERWRQVEELYHAALERVGAQRAAFIEKTCAGDNELRREVESLLADDSQTESFLEAPALEAAARSLADDRTGSIVGCQLDSYKVL